MKNKRFIGDDHIDWDLEAERSIKGPMRVDGVATILDYIDEYLKEGTLILDVGCNIGRWVYVFLHHKMEYEGLDASPTAIRIASHIFPALVFHNINAVDIDFVDKYDVIFTNTVMQHIKTPNQRIIFKNIHRALKQDGVFIMREKDDVQGGTAKDYDGWRDLFEEAGLELIEYIPIKEGVTNTSTYILRREQ